MGVFDRFAVLSFDCYGTLIDWEAGLGSALAAWASRREVELAGEALLARFAEHETVVQGEGDPPRLYPEVLAETLRRIGAELGAEVSDADATAIAGSVGDWPAFPDSHDALRRLHERFRLVVVSNVDRASFAGSRARLGVDFDGVITAEEVGAYKPRLPHFDALFATLDEWGVPRDRLLHVAQSLYHDHGPAKALGLPTVWIDRRGGRSGGATPTVRGGQVAPDWRFGTLAAFADAATGTTRATGTTPATS